MAWYAPYILADGQVDARSYDTILGDPRFAGKHGEDLAVALWQWLVDPREGFYHFLAGTEEPGETLTADPVKDPLRLLNNYGYGLCGNVAMLFAGLYDWAGGKSRVVGVVGHTISEAYWAGKWHLIDCDLRALHYRKTKQGFEIASLHDLIKNPDLVARPDRKSDPYYTGDEAAAKIADGCYRPGKEEYFPSYFYRLGSMDYALRPGESLTCYWQPQGRFYWGKGWGEWIKDKQRRSFTGPADKKDPRRRYVNACIRWRPDLSADIDEVGVSTQGFESTAAGLVARSEATLRYRLVSPYVICGRYEKCDFGGRRVDALLVRINASAAPAVTIHTPRNGRTCVVRMQGDRDEYTADLTEWADLHYAYELRISLPAGQVLRGVAVNTWCQASPMTLPVWYEPGRTVRLAAGCAWKGLERQAVLPHLEDLVGSLKSQTGGRLEKGRFGESVTEKILPEAGEVRAVAAVEPPVPGRIVRLHAMAAMPSAKQPGEAAGDVVLEMASSSEGPWELLDCRPVEVHPQGFHFSAEGWRNLAQPVRRVWLRLRSPRAVGVWRVRVDYVPDASAGATAEAAPAGSPLDLLLRWRQDGVLRMYTRRLTAADVGRPFVAVTEPGEIQPLHMVLSVPSRGER